MRKSWPKQPRDSKSSKTLQNRSCFLLLRRLPTSRWRSQNLKRTKNLFWSTLHLQKLLRFQKAFRCRRRCCRPGGWSAWASCCSAKTWKSWRPPSEEENSCRDEWVTAIAGDVCNSDTLREFFATLLTSTLSSWLRAARATSSPSPCTACSGWAPWSDVWIAASLICWRSGKIRRPFCCCLLTCRTFLQEEEEEEVSAPISDLRRSASSSDLIRRPLHRGRSPRSTSFARPAGWASSSVWRRSESCCVGPATS